MILLAALRDGAIKQGQFIFGSSLHHVEITHDPRDMRVSSVTLQIRKEKQDNGIQRSKAS